MPASVVADLRAYADIDRAEVLRQALAEGVYRRVRQPLVVSDPARAVAAGTGKGRAPGQGGAAGRPGTASADDRGPARAGAGNAMGSMRTAQRLCVAAITCCAMAATGAAVSPAEAAAALPPDGSFIEVVGEVYEIVGGAPIRVSNWAAVGDRKTTLKIDVSIFYRLADYPKDGTFVRASDGRCYRFVGGAPFYISTWSAYGGAQKALLIDAAAITHAGAPVGSGYTQIRSGRTTWPATAGTSSPANWATYRCPTTARCSSGAARPAGSTRWSVAPRRGSRIGHCSADRSQAVSFAGRLDDAGQHHRPERLIGQDVEPHPGVGLGQDLPQHPR